MVTQGAHIIHRLVLQIEVPKRSMAKPIQDEVMRCWESDILPQLQQLLDNLDNDTYILIDRLELKLETLSSELLAAQLSSETLHRFDEAIGRKFSNGIEDETDSLLSLDSNQFALEAFVYFLQKGSLPWYVGSQAEWLGHEQQWLDKLMPAIAPTGNSQQLLSVLASSPQALLRLFAQFSGAFIWQITKAVLNIDAEFVKRQSFVLQEMLNTGFSKKNASEALLNSADVDSLVLFILLHTPQDKAIRNTQLKHIAKHFIPLLQQRYDNGTAINRQSILSILADIVKEQATDTLLTKTVELLLRETSDKKDVHDEIDGLFVKQAGIIILHPFLEYFFKNLALVDADDFVDEPARHLAVHLLHYMATGQTHAFEHDLQMEKFLCGWPEQKPVERRVNLPGGMQTEADSLLHAAIRHWKALKNTSPGGLREGFLTRNGKLITSEETPRLIVEHSDLDILLASLPWGIGVVKQPWMSKALYVEWP